MPLPTTFHQTWPWADYVTPTDYDSRSNFYPQGWNVGHLGAGESYSYCSHSGINLLTSWRAGNTKIYGPVGAVSSNYGFGPTNTQSAVTYLETANGTGRETFLCVSMGQGLFQPGAVINSSHPKFAHYYGTHPASGIIDTAGLPYLWHNTADLASKGYGQWTSLPATTGTKLNPAPWSMCSHWSNLLAPVPQVFNIHGLSTSIDTNPSSFVQGFWVKYDSLPARWTISTTVAEIIRQDHRNRLAVWQGGKLLISPVLTPQTSSFTFPPYASRAKWKYEFNGVDRFALLYDLTWTDATTWPTLGGNVDIDLSDDADPLIFGVAHEVDLLMGASYATSASMYYYVGRWYPQMDLVHSMNVEGLEAIWADNIVDAGGELIDVAPPPPGP